MQCVIYRLNELEGHRSWRPRSLTDMRGPRFPEEYHEQLVIDAESLDGVLGQYESMLGDVVFLGDDDETTVFAAGPLGWEAVKFGLAWRSPE